MESNSRLGAPLHAWSMWGLAVLFFSYQFIMRLFPGLVMQDIMQKHEVDVLSFGLLSSMYYFGYAGMQIPIAILLERYGPRKILTLFILICSLGILLFVYATHWKLVLLSRFLIGVGSAVGFLGTSKIVSMYFPAKQYAKMIGLSFTVGLLGAFYGGKPVSMLIQTDGWESVGAWVGLCGLVFAALSFFLIKELKGEKSVQEPVLKSLKEIARNPYLPLLAIANLLMVGSLEGFADVWGVSFLTNAYALEKVDAAFVTSWIFIGMLFGGPLLTSLASRFSTYLVTAMSGVVMALLFGVLLLGFPTLPYSALCGVLFIIGIFCCYQVLVFVLGTQLSPPHLQGMTVAFLNCVNMLGGSFFHLLIASLLKFSDGEDASNLSRYSPESFASALSAIPVCALIGASLILLIAYAVKKRPVYAQI